VPLFMLPKPASDRLALQPFFLVHGRLFVFRPYVWLHVCNVEVDGLLAQLSWVKHVQT
jgi:hypothetical protein